MSVSFSKDDRVMGNVFFIDTFIEVKIDQVELEGLKNKFDGFELFANIEAEFSNKPRGGIIILVKKLRVQGFLQKPCAIFDPQRNMRIFGP